MSHRRCWQNFWSLVAAVGVGLAMLEWSALVVGCAVVLLVVVTAALLTIMRPAEHWVGSGAVGWCREVLPRSLAAAGCVVAAWAAATVSPAVCAVVIMAALLSSPVAVSQVRRARGRPAPRAEAAPPAPEDRSGPQAPEPEQGSSGMPPEAAAALDALDDGQLCRMWRESFWDLRAATPQTLLGIVALREACLNELERRNAAALHAWLESGARASGGPEKFLSRPGHGSSEAA